MLDDIDEEQNYWHSIKSTFFHKKNIYEKNINEKKIFFHQNIVFISSHTSQKRFN